MSKNNRVSLIGHLGFDPEVRELAAGRKVARMSVSTNDRYTDKDGMERTDTQWHTVVSWGRMAEDVERMLKKGSKVNVIGRIVHRSYKKNDGQSVYMTEIVLESFQLL